jgi:hypothetical protein
VLQKVAGDIMAVEKLAKVIVASKNSGGEQQDNEMNGDGETS